jgi:hypothetical protein
MTQPEKQLYFRRVIKELKRGAAFAEAMQNESVTKETASTLRELASDAYELAKKFHGVMWTSGDPAPRFAPSPSSACSTSSQQSDSPS